MGLKGPCFLPKWVSLQNPSAPPHPQAPASSVALSLLRPQQQLLNISLITVPIHVVCICMSSTYCDPLFSYRSHQWWCYYSSFRKKVSTRLPVKPENIILSVSRSLKVSADLVKENTPKSALLSWNPLPAPNFLEANLREESLKRKCEPRGIQRLPFQKSLISKTTILIILF